MPEMTYAESTLLQAQNKHIAELKAKIEQLKGEIADWRTDRDQLRQAVEERNQTIRLQDAKIERLQKTINAKEGAIKTLQQERDDREMYWRDWNGGAANRAALLEGEIERLNGLLESANDRLDKAGLSLGGDLEIYPLWLAAFALCNRPPPAERPDSLSAWPDVDRWAQRILKEVPPVKGPSNRVEKHSSDDEAILNAYFVKRSDKPISPSAKKPVAKKKNQPTPIPVPELPPDVRAALRREIVRPIAVQEARRQGRELDLCYSRVDLQEWALRPENAAIKSVATFLFNDQELSGGPPK